MGWIAFKGFFIYIYYWGTLPAILFFGVALSVILFRALQGRVQSVKTNLCQLGILAVCLLGGTFIGYELRCLKCREICAATEPVIAGIQKYYDEHGYCPERLNDLEAVKRLRIETDFSFGQTWEKDALYYVSFFDVYDAAFHLEGDKVTCTVLATYLFPMSITRYYAYVWIPETRSWRYEKFIWTWQGTF